MRFNPAEKWPASSDAPWPAKSSAIRAPGNSALNWGRTAALWLGSHGRTGLHPELLAGTDALPAVAHSGSAPKTRQVRLLGAALWLHAHPARQRDWSKAG